MPEGFPLFSMAFNRIALYMLAKEFCLSLHPLWPRLASYVTQQELSLLSENSHQTAMSASLLQRNMPGFH